ncbi:MAG: D-3-phosphoglycerate dehydrogenase [Planctomycetota bacterium]|jgi:D-3-phosphoglycerate dehydrogenase
MRILICDELHSSAVDVFESHGFTPEIRTGMTEAELIAAVPGVNALVIRSATKVTRAVIEAADSLQVVGRAGVGVDNVDTDAASERGVVVMNTPTGNTTTTAELAIALITSLARHLPRADRTTRSGSWSKKGLMGTELTGKCLGVVGLGRIGRVVAERGMGLAMNVIAADPYLTKTGAGSPVAGVDLLELDDLLARADFVSLHIPLMDSTRGLISEERIAKMKPGARLINAARGGLIDEAALAVALDEGRLAGAALDVLAEEPPSDDHPLMGRDDVILTPHLGASSHEAQRNVAVQVADQISAFFRDGVANNAINAPALPAKALRELTPYIRLAEKMGSFLAQRCEEPIRKIELTFTGEIVSREAKYLELAFTAAVLRHGLGRPVNFVNAPLLAKERGLRVLHSEEIEPSFFTNRLKARVSSKGGSASHVVSGTTYGDEPRFTRIDEIHVDIAPAGHMLVTRHTDSPGVLGKLGTILGEAGVNIRRVELGPPTQASGGYAAAFLTMYSSPNAKVMDSLRELEPVEHVQLIEL